MSAAPQTSETVQCPMCSKTTYQAVINDHIDSGCTAYVVPQPKKKRKRTSKGDSKKNTAKRPKSNAAALNALFDNYADEEQKDLILVNGIMKFCEDIEVDSQDVLMIIISWLLKAKEMCVYTRDEFVQGFDKLGIASVEDIKANLPRFRDTIKEEHNFKDFYQYTYEFGLEPTSKQLSIDAAKALWKLVLEGRFALLDEWISFLDTTKQSVSRDLWTMFLSFSKEIKPDLSNYDEDDAWPYLIDTFVESLKEKGVGAATTTASTS